MAVTTSTASGGGAGAGFLAQERQTSPARKSLESLIVEKTTLCGTGATGSGISTSSVIAKTITGPSRARFRITSSAIEAYAYRLDWMIRQFSRKEIAMRQNQI